MVLRLAALFALLMTFSIGSFAEPSNAATRQEFVLPQALSPASPKEECAGRPLLISEPLCEARACEKPEWHDHPYCVELRARGHRRDANNQIRRP